MGSILPLLLPAPASFYNLQLPASSSAAASFSSSSSSSSSSSNYIKTFIHQPPHFRSSPLFPAAARKDPKGFGSTVSSQKPKKLKQKRGLRPNEEKDEEEDDEEERDEAAGTIPEVVTNRMMRRMGLSVGIPLAVGVLFFPFFYYLKVVAKIDVPTWIPFLVSFFFFGASLLGISYGIVSASWDPLREGSLLGLNEARRNWPVFWQSLWGGGGNAKK